jgi:NOL1/NOP2/sun family putative RNA methylase
MIKPKPLFLERIRLMLGDETEKYLKSLEREPFKSIRVNTLKIDVNELKERLAKKGWKIEQPFDSFPQALRIKSNLLPGELGKAIEHQLGYYYAQELASMMPPIALAPEKQDIILDLCAAPGSKTTEMAIIMENQGTVIANDIRPDRIIALTSNLERCGVSNTIVTRMNGIILCRKLAEKGFFFDKILVDATCSGEGIIRSDPDAMKIWNVNMIKKYSSMQKRLLSEALSCLKPEGILVYSTCTHAPEENEEVIDFAIKKFNVKVQDIKLPLKTRQGMTEWKGRKFDEQVKRCARIWPQDNDTEGFFVAKIKK